MFRKIMIWFYMLSKRLYKKPSFLLILLLIPLTVMVYGKAAQEDSGIMTVALAAEDPQDMLVCEIMDELLDSSPLIRYIKLDSPQEAEEQVLMHGADVAWIFPENMQQKIDAFITAEKSPQPIVHVITRENNVAIMLSSEKLSGLMFKYCARAYYLRYLRDNAMELSAYTDEEILGFYDEALIGDQLFSFTNTTGNDTSSAKLNYLLTPMRGLLGVIMALCGLATAMYYVKDDAAGTFAYLPNRQKVFAEAGYQTVSLVNVSAITLLALVILGLSVDVGREMLIMVVYAMSVISFSMLVRVCCGSLRGLGTAMVLLVVLMIAVCPVFYDFAALRSVQLLLPPTYFVNAAYNDTYFCYMLVYTGICLVLSTGFRVLFKRN